MEHCAKWRRTPVLHRVFRTEILKACIGETSHQPITVRRSVNPAICSGVVKQFNTVPDRLTTKTVSELHSMLIEEIKSTNARIDTFIKESAIKKKKKTSDDNLEIDNLSVEEYFSQGKEEAKPDTNISILSTLSDKFASSKKTIQYINAELSKILKSIVH